MINFAFLAGGVAMPGATIFFPVEDALRVVRFPSVEGLSKAARDVRPVVHEPGGHGYGDRPEI